MPAIRLGLTREGLPDYKDLLQRTERAKDRLIECSLLLSRAARWTFGLDFVSPGHWFARKARRQWQSAKDELDEVRRYFEKELPQAEVPSAWSMLGEELAWWIGLRPVESTRAGIQVSEKWKWPLASPFDIDDPSITFEQRMLTTRLEIDHLLDAVATLSAKLRAHVLAG